MDIAEIKGIGSEHAAALERAGIGTVERLLERGASPAGRRDIGEATGIGQAILLDWVNRADLMRIDGVGVEYSDLLEAAGVDSPAELARRNPANLTATVARLVGDQPGLVRRTPAEREIADWIEQAKRLPKLVTHGGSGTDDDRADEPGSAPNAAEAMTAAAGPAAATAPTPAAAPAAPAPAAPAPTVAPMAARSTDARAVTAAPRPAPSRWTQFRRWLRRTLRMS
jgi:predicted flap endonuclease-1-like 5' DNA nuclease